MLPVRPHNTHGKGAAAARRAADAAVRERDTGTDDEDSSSEDEVYIGDLRLDLLELRWGGAAASLGLAVFGVEEEEEEAAEGSPP